MKDPEEEIILNDKGLCQMLNIEEMAHRLESNKPVSLSADMEELLKGLTGMIQMTSASIWFATHSLNSIKCYKLIRSSDKHICSGCQLDRTEDPLFFERMEKESIIRINSTASVHTIHSVIKKCLGTEESSLLIYVLRMRGAIYGLLICSKSAVSEDSDWTREEKFAISYAGKMALSTAEYYQHLEYKQQLRQKESQLTTLSENMSDLITEVTPDMRILYVSPSCRKMLGYEPVERIGRKISDLVHPEDIQLIKDPIRRIYSYGTEEYATYRIKHKEGHYVWLESLGRRVKGEDGKLKSVVITSRNVTERRAVEEELLKSYQEARHSILGLIRTLEAVVEVKDPYTAGHQQNVAKISRAVGSKMGLGKEALETLEMAASVHDIGKFRVPTEVLCKPGKISPVEFQLIQEHAKHGEELMRKVSTTWPLSTIVGQHHERLDGSGYPRGLSAEEIMIESKILMVADVYDAMASHRPYRPALGREKALEELTANAGILYDAEAVRALEEVLDEWDDEQEEKPQRGLLQLA